MCASQSVLPDNVRCTHSVQKALKDKLTPQPLADANTRCHALIAGAQDVLKGYADRKRELWVIDFSDMVAAAARLLAEQPKVLETVLGEID